MNLTDLLQDFSTISALLIVAYIIRIKVKIFQKYFIPVSLLGGTLGLLLGPQVLGTFSPIYISYPSDPSKWTIPLLTIVFATSFLGSKAEKFGKDAASATFIAAVIHHAQILLGLLVTFVISKFIKDIPYEFGVLPVAAFYGGPGSAGIVGAAFQQLGWNEALGIGMTFATIGILSGVIFGMVIINAAVRKGYAKMSMSITEMGVKSNDGYVPFNQRTPIGNAVTRNSVIDPLALQLAFVGGTIAISSIVRISLIRVIPIVKEIPLYAFSLVFGAVISILMNKTKYADVVDSGSIRRISGIALEYMIASAIVSVSIEIFTTYLIPMILLSVAVVILNTILSIYLCKRWHKENWFEVAIGMFGQCCGILSTGLLLIKVVDPDHKTFASESIGASSTLGYIFQMPYSIFGPMILVASPKLYTLGTLGMWIIFIIIGHILFGRREKSKYNVS